MHGAGSQSVEVNYFIVRPCSFPLQSVNGSDLQGKAWVWLSSCWQWPVHGTGSGCWGLLLSEVLFSPPVVRQVPTFSIFR